jgi:hypothetical protein
MCFLAQLFSLHKEMKTWVYSFIEKYNSMIDLRTGFRQIQ